MNFLMIFFPHLIDDADIIRVVKICFHAGELADQLKAKGIDTEIVEDDGKYKVISPVLKTKDEALEQLDQIKDKSVEDVFIASF